MITVSKQERIIIKAMRHVLPSLLLSALLCLPACAQSLEARYAPTPRPDRLILNVTADPATSMAVTWRTDTSVKHAYVEFVLADDGPNFEKNAKRVTATTAEFESQTGKAHYHSVVLSGLAPNSVYTYRVGADKEWTEWNQFRTASKEARPFRFIYFGDAQNDILQMWSRVVREAYREASTSSFIIHAGDLVNSGTRDVEWGEWHQAAGWINAMTPSLPTPGNHEYGVNPLRERKLTSHWKTQFTLPGNGVSALDESNYYVDIQGVRIVSLNSNEMQKEQAEWLDKTLANNPNKWTVLTFHHPIYSTARNRDNKALREVWQPVIDKYAVDLVLTGHDHSYGRSNLNTGTNARTGKNGTVYVVSVSGPKMYELTRGDWMVRAAEQTQLYQVISVDGDRLSFESRTGAGRLYDAFELRKRPGQSNELINKIPAEMKERVRP